MIGEIVKGNKKKKWYPCICEDCGWIGSSEKCGTDYGFDDTDVYCPRCGSPDTDEYTHNYYPMHYLITNVISILKTRRKEVPF